MLFNNLTTERRASLIVKNSKFYMYNAETKKFYRWFYQGEPIDFNVDNGNGDAKVIKKLLSDGSFIELKKKYLRESGYLKRVAKRIENVESVSFSGSEERGTVDLLIKGKGGCDIRVDIFNAYAAAGCPVISFGGEAKSLENEFLKAVAVKEYEEGGEE